MLSLNPYNSHCPLRNTFWKSDPLALSLSKNFYRIWELTALLPLVIFVAVYAVSLVTISSGLHFQSSPKPWGPASVCTVHLILPDNFPESASAALVLYPLPIPMKQMDLPWKLSWPFLLDRRFWNLSPDIQILYHSAWDTRIIRVSYLSQ